MAKHLVLVSHGRFCEELKASTEMIMGPQDNIHAVALLPEEGPEEFTAITAWSEEKKLIQRVHKKAS